jgi:hypothetical protein
MPPAENPRWTACRVALGHEPTTVDFFEWMRTALAEFCREAGIQRNRLLADAKPGDVTAWLERRAEAQAAAREKGVA